MRDPNRIPEILFQWGHDFSAMDSLDLVTTTTPPGAFQWGHDFSAMDRFLRATFDEVGEFQWGHDFSAMDR